MDKKVDHDYQLDEKNVPCTAVEGYLQMRKPFGVDCQSQPTSVAVVAARYNLKDETDTVCISLDTQFIGTHPTN
jgi:hypothetical protein